MLPHFCLVFKDCCFLKQYCSSWGLFYSYFVPKSRFNSKKCSALLLCIAYCLHELQCGVRILKASKAARGQKRWLMVYFLFPWSKIPILARQVLQTEPGDAAGASPAHWGSPGGAAALPTGVSGWELQFWAGFVGICDPRAPKGP